MGLRLLFDTLNHKPDAQVSKYSVSTSSQILLFDVGGTFIASGPVVSQGLGQRSLTHKMHYLHLLESLNNSPKVPG